MIHFGRVDNVVLMKIFVGQRQGVTSIGGRGSATNTGTVVRSTEQTGLLGATNFWSRRGHRGTHDGTVGNGNEVRLSHALRLVARGSVTGGLPNRQ